MSSRIKYYTFIPALILAAGILVTSLLEADQMLQTSLADKTLHIWAYCAFIITLLWPLVYLYGHHWNKYLMAWMACGTYGAVVELLQSHCTRTRVGEWMDIVANSIGTTIGLIIFFCIYYLWLHLHTNTK